MADLDFDEIQAEFRQSLTDCQQLYQSAALQVLEHQSPLISGSDESFLELMNDLHKGLLIKIYGSIAQADRRWTAQEARLAEVLFEHLWNQQLSGDKLKDAALHVFDQSTKLKWYSLVRPFEALAPLRDRVDELETIIMRLANLVAKCDGTISDGEAAFLQTIEAEIHQHLRPLTLDDSDDESDEEQSSGRAAAQEVQQIESRTPHLSTPARRKTAAPRGPSIAKQPPEQQLQQAMADLNALIGLDSIKREIATLTNFLNLQRQRTAAGLPTTDLSLHMVFTGNPGTGKTSVARIVGRLLGAMGILAKGQLIETDRSGLVAQYAGQTGPKTQKKVDEAIDGVLFIDEAYSLVAEEGEDAYGSEALQALLKRMEDDRHRLVLILAGYPEPMTSLLRSNAGLGSRFSTTMNFEDYRPHELGLIFQTLCDKNRYRVPGPTQARLLIGFRWLHANRDEHFGNGRLVRNVFERAIRHLANRVATITPLTTDLLTLIQPEDIEFPDVPPHVLKQAQNDSQRFLVTCPGCKGHSPVPAAYLGRLVKCNSCQHRFTASWGQPLDPPAAPSAIK